MTQYFDGPGLAAADHAKANETARVSRLETEKNTLLQQVKELEIQRHRLGDDLKRANTDLIQYKDRTCALQKQVCGLKSGKFPPDKVPEFKSHNPNQQIIKALLKENEELNTRIERLKEIKEKVTTNAANKNQSELFDALTYLEEENRNLRGQLNLEDTSQHSVIRNESETAEMSQLREKLRVSTDLRRDLADQVEAMKIDLEINKAQNPSPQTPRRPMVVKEHPMPVVSRTPAGLQTQPQPQYMPYPQVPMPQRAQMPMEMPFLPAYARYDINPPMPTYPTTYINNSPSIPPAVITPGVPPGTLHPQEQSKHTGPSPYKQQDHLGYK